MKRKIVVFLLALVFVAAMAAACGGTSPYKTFSFDHRTKPGAQNPAEQVTHFSFEYPRDYRRTSSYVKPNPAAPIGVRFARATGALGCVRQTDTVFGINIGYGFSGYMNAAESASRAASALGEGGLVRERSSVIVAGLTGDQVIYHDPRQPNAPEVTDVFFDYDGRTWNLYIYSEAALAEQAKLDFEHIIDTFKILP